MKPLVSIIIPCFNRAHLISETLNSVLAQTYVNWECIVIDDGSTDKSKSIIFNYCETDKRFKLINRPKNVIKGANTCRNIGVDRCNGEYIIFLDSDDKLGENCLTNRVKIINNNSSINILISNTEIFGSLNNRLINIDPLNKTAKEYLYMFLKYDVPWQTSSAFYKKNIIKGIRFDESLQRLQDVSFNIDLLLTLNNETIYRNYEVDNFYRKESIQDTDISLILKVLRSYAHFFNKYRYLIKDENFKRCLRRFNYFILVSLIVPNFYNTKKISVKVFSIVVASDLYNFKQKCLLSFFILFLKTKIYLVKGIGMYKFQQFVYKSIRASA